MITIAPLIVIAGAVIILVGALRRNVGIHEIPQCRVSVREALEKLDELDGKLVELVGTLNVDHEDYCINEFSPPEAVDLESRWARNSSIWTSYGRRFSNVELQKLHQKEAVLVGYIRKPQHGYDGCGHFSGWPAEIEVVKAQALTAA